MKSAKAESISVGGWKEQAKELVLPEWAGKNWQKQNGARLSLTLSHKPSETIRHYSDMDMAEQKAHQAGTR